MREPARTLHGRTGHGRRERERTGRAHKATSDTHGSIITCMVRLVAASLLILTARVGAAPVEYPELLSSERARAFERVYSEGRWINGADGARRCPSGWSDVGSGQAVAAVRAVVSVVDMFQLRSIADVPCGDGCFARAMLSALRNRTAAAASPPISYVGIDIVRSLVERNRATMGNQITRFIAEDVADGIMTLPSADLLFSRQMLQHLCTADALRFVRRVASSSARFALLSTFRTDDEFVNTDIPCASGEYRPQDLTKPPFNLPPPLALFDEMYPVDRRIALGLWKVATLRHRLL